MSGKDALLMVCQNQSLEKATVSAIKRHFLSASFAWRITKNHYKISKVTEGKKVFVKQQHLAVKMTNDAYSIKSCSEISGQMATDNNVVFN